MDVVVDANIPGAAQAFAELGSVRLLSGEHIERQSIRNADVLLVRSVTRVDDGLVDGSRLCCVGSATTGTDHVDLPSLARRGIAFMHAPGSNAESVVEWVLAALLRVSAHRSVELRGKTVGIVGCGNVGRRLSKRLGAFGVRILKNDPPLAKRGSGDFVSLGRLLAEADIVSLHVPLTGTGAFPTSNLIGKAELSQLQPGAWVVNTSRGRVIDEDALVGALRAGQVGAAILDVWATEPDPNGALLELADVVSPHVAGHSFDGKLQGTVMLHRALMQHFGREATWNGSDLAALTDFEQLPLPAPAPDLPETAWLDAFVRPLCDLQRLDSELRTMRSVKPHEHGVFFSALRKSCPRRRAFRLRWIPKANVPAPLHHVVEHGVGIRLAG